MPLRQRTGTTGPCSPRASVPLRLAPSSRALACNISRAESIRTHARPVASVTTPFQVAVPSSGGSPSRAALAVGRLLRRARLLRRLLRLDPVPRTPAARRIPALLRPSLPATAAARLLPSHGLRSSLWPLAWRSNRLLPWLLRLLRPKARCAPPDVRPPSRPQNTCTAAALASYW